MRKRLQLSLEWKTREAFDIDIIIHEANEMHFSFTNVDTCPLQCLATPLPDHTFGKLNVFNDFKK